MIFPRLSTYSQIVAELQWDPAAIDFAPDARAWPALPEERRRRLTTLLAGFCVAEDAVAEHLTPFADVAEHVDTMMMWIFFLQRRDEDRHALFFDRVAAEVLGLPGQTPGRAPRRGPRTRPGRVPRAVRGSGCPRWLPSSRRGAPASPTASGLYHMVLEGAVFTAGQRALLDDLEDGALPGVREGVEHVDLDERWHVGFGVRCLTEAGDPDLVLEEVLARATEAAGAWGDAVPAATREYAARAVSPTAGGRRPRRGVAGGLEIPTAGAGSRRARPVNLGRREPLLGCAMYLTDRE